MMQFMLDTNICIYLIKAHPPAVLNRFAQFRKGEVVISAVTWAELCAGAGKEGAEMVQNSRRGLAVADFDRQAGVRYGELTALHPNRKKSFDRMIAAHALALDVTLVSNNTADFAIYENSGLRLDNWVSD